MDDGSIPLCAVCNERAHGMHHGVPTCRNCAVFFARSVNKEEVQYGTQLEERNKSGKSLNLIPKLVPIPDTNSNAYTFLNGLYLFLKSVSRKYPGLEELLMSIESFLAKRREELKSTTVFNIIIFTNLRNAYYSINKQSKKYSNADDDHCSLCDFLSDYRVYIQRTYPFSPQFTTLVQMIHNKVSDDKNNEMFVSATAIFNAFSPIFYYFS